MRRKIEEKIRAIRYREKGFSLREIVEKVGVAKSSVSAWVRNVPVEGCARERLLTKIKLGQIVSAERKRARMAALLMAYKQDAAKLLPLVSNPQLSWILCSLMYWCEGRKSVYEGIGFTNSDPRLVKTFLTLLRRSFPVDESKFHPTIHIHGYHAADTQIDFWSRITNIKKVQFTKPYRKPNGGMRIRKDYQGCISLRYHSNDLARRLLMTADAFLDKYGPIG